MAYFKHTLALLTCALAAGAANAATVQITFDNPIFGTQQPDNVWIKVGAAKPEHVAAGRFQGEVSNTPGESPPLDLSIFYKDDGKVFMYCYDIHESISHGQNVQYTVHQDPGASMVNIQTLKFIGAVNSVLQATGTPFNPYAWLKPTGAQGAAIQLGLWESKYDTGWNLFDGAFKVTNHLNDETKAWWDQFHTAVQNNVTAIDNKYVVFLENIGAQDMLAGDPPGEVPEPSSLALIGLALAGLAATRRKSSP